MEPREEDFAFKEAVREDVRSATARWGVSGTLALAAEEACSGSWERSSKAIPAETVVCAELVVGALGSVEEEAEAAL